MLNYCFSLIDVEYLYRYEAVSDGLYHMKNTAATTHIKGSTNKTHWL